VYAERSTDEKDAYFSVQQRSDLQWGQGEIYNILNIAQDISERKLVKAGEYSSAGLLSASIKELFTASERLPSSVRAFHKKDIKRVSPSPSLTSASFAKNMFKENMFPYYRSQIPTANWSYTNYNTLNFMSNARVPSGSCIIYPAFTGTFNIQYDKSLPHFMLGSDKSGLAQHDVPNVFGISKYGHPDYTNWPLGSKAYPFAGHKALGSKYTPYLPHPKYGPTAPLTMESEDARFGSNPLSYNGVDNGETRSFFNRTQFTFEFWIKPSYNDLNTAGNFKAGTLMHMSSCYAISLVSGSEKDLYGRPSTFRMMLQLSHSAEYPPSSILLNDSMRGTLGTQASRLPKPYDLIFASSKNSLRFNHWHHVAIRWGSDAVQDGIGSFVIDGKTDTEFQIQSGTVFPPPCVGVGNRRGADGTGVISQYPTSHPDFYNRARWFMGASGRNWEEIFRNTGRENPNALFVGNFYEGRNHGSRSAYADDGSSIRRFFNTNVDRNEGIETGFDFPQNSGAAFAATGRDPTISSYSLVHPLQAEVHEIRLWNTYRTIDEIQDFMVKGLGPKEVKYFPRPWLYPPHYTNIVQPFTNKTKFWSTNNVLDTFNTAITAGVGSDNFWVTLQTGLAPLCVYLDDIPNLLFYLPVLFTKNSGPHPRKMLISPAQVATQTTCNPFNAELSFRTNTTEINLPNFVRDFATGQYPRLFMLTSSVYNDDMGLNLSRADTSNLTLPAKPWDFTAAKRVVGDGSGSLGQYFMSRPKTASGVNSLAERFNQVRGLWSLGGSEDYLPGTTTPNPDAKMGPERRKASLRRNLTILPCDNGKFKPNWMLLLSGTDVAKVYDNLAWQNNTVIRPVSGSLIDKFVNDLGHLDLSVIGLQDMWYVHSGAAGEMTLITDTVGKENPEYELALCGPTPERWMASVPHPTSDGGHPIAKYVPSMVNRIVGTPSIVQAPAPTTPPYDPDPERQMVYTPSASSNAVSWYDISSLYYGDRIKPGSLRLQGSVGCININVIDLGLMSGTIPMTIRDDGNGSLYRADALTPHAKWNNVGNVLYDEGFVIIKSPHIADLGLSQKEGWSIDFAGEKNMHILEMMVELPAGRFTSSSNPSWKSSYRASDHVSDEDSQFVYITGLNFHDENFNIIARSNLAQPVAKREEDKLFFRVKLDF
tara:strand:- start:5414 stop:8884 length:3471 start_codon:yes stop_codon:yes gene_type:complete